MIEIRILQYVYADIAKSGMYLSISIEDVKIEFLHNEKWFNAAIIIHVSQWNCNWSVNGAVWNGILWMLYRLR